MSHFSDLVHLGQQLALFAESKSFELLPLYVQSKRLGGHEFAQAAYFAASTCRDELALIVFVFRASPFSLAERGSDSVAP